MKLVDSHHRRFHYLRLSITDVCNFKCNYCLPDGYQCDSERNFLNLLEISRVCNAFAEMGVSKIRITGGEPALRKDLCAIIRTVSDTPNIKTVALTTNGFNLINNINDWVSAGLTQLNVSIDSLSAKTFQLITGSHRHEQILAGIDRAIELGIKVKVNVVLLNKFNASEFEQFLAWLKHKPVTLRFIELMQTGDNEDFFQLNHVRGEQLKKELIKNGWSHIVKTKDAGPAQELFHPEYKGKVGFILPYSKDFCQSCNRLRVSSKGQLHPCLFAEQGLDFRHFLQSDDQKPQLKVWLQQQLMGKKVSHYLHDKQSGATKHLAMLGG